METAHRIRQAVTALATVPTTAQLSGIETIANAQLYNLNSGAALTPTSTTTTIVNSQTVINRTYNLDFCVKMSASFLLVGARWGL